MFGSSQERLGSQGNKFGITNQYHFLLVAVYMIIPTRKRIHLEVKIRLHKTDEARNEILNDISQFQLLHGLSLFNNFLQTC